MSKEYLSVPPLKYSCEYRRQFIPDVRLIDVDSSPVGMTIGCDIKPMGNSGKSGCFNWIC